ncbi:hypothetical protein Tco_0080036 [Tanacetum coccineum]
MAALQYKDDHNRIAYLGRERGSEDFIDILSYLDHSPLRAQLQLDDANGIFDMHIDDIFAGMGAIGYPPALRREVGIPVPSYHCHKPLYVYRLHLPGSIQPEAHPVPHPPPFSPVREPTPERLPETEWVVPIPVSPITDWRPWPSVPAPSPIRDPTPEPASPPIPPALTLRLEEPVIFGPLPRPANYIAPEDIDNLNSMEDDTIFGGFHEETHAGPDDAPTTTAECWLKGNCGYPRSVRPLRHTRMHPEANVHNPATVPSEDIEAREEEEVPLRRKRSIHRRARTEFNTSAFAQFHAPHSSDVLPHADISESAGPSVGADKGKAPMPDLEIPAEFLAEDAQARQRLEEEQASARLVQQLQAEDLAQADVPPVSGASRYIIFTAREKLVELMSPQMTTLLSARLPLRNGSRELLLQIIRYRALKGKPLKQSEVTKMMRNLVKNQWCAAHNGTITMKAVTAMSKQHLLKDTRISVRRLEKDRFIDPRCSCCTPKHTLPDDPDSAGGRSFHPAGSTPMSGSAVPETAGGPLDTTDSDIEDFKRCSLDSDEDTDRYFRLNPDVDVGLDLWRDVNLLCQSLIPDMGKIFWRTQDEMGCQWLEFHAIRAPTAGKDVTHTKAHSSTLIQSDVVVAGSVIQRFRMA